MQVSDKKATQKSAKSATASSEQSQGFTDAERAAMRARAKELKADARADKNRADGESAALAAIAAMTGRDRAMGERIHAIVTASAPSLAPKTWYGMPAYARDGKVVCFFKSAEKLKDRYATLGFNDAAQLDERRASAHIHARTRGRWPRDLCEHRAVDPPRVARPGWRRLTGERVDDPE